MAPRSARPIRVVAATGAVLTALACAPAPVPSPATAEPPAAAPDWQPCPDGPQLQCATLTVPLDHADPAIGTIELALSRRPATEPAAGEPIVLNRGGPGYSTVDYLAAIVAGQLPAPVDDTVLARHDLVALDPRGTGRSGPDLPCRPDPDTPPAAPGALPEPGPRAGLAPFPDVPFTDAGLDERLAREREIRAQCRERPESAHLGTVDAARDLDLLRRAMGRDRLTMIGQSYGGHLATVYAALHPERVGRLVLDSTVGPGRGAEGGTDAARSGNDVATEATLVDFLDRCAAAGPACPFGAGDPAGTFDRIVDGLRDTPVQLRAADGTTVALTAPHVLEQVGGLLYQPSTWAPLLAPYLQAVAQVVADPNAPIASGVAYGVQLADRRPADSLQAGFDAVACGEVPTPGDAAAWAASVRERAELAPRFAALRASDTLPCVGQPRTAAPLPPLTAPIPTAGQVLLVHNRLDPATPLAGAQATETLFERSALLVNEGPGHVAAQQSRCTVAAASAFLTEGRLPAPDATCAPDRDPFAP